MRMFAVDDLSIDTAVAADAESVAALVNAAYRGETSKQGWTTEADLLDGRRTEAQAIARLLAEPDSVLLLGRCHARLVATVHLQRHGTQAHLGMLTVDPTLQGFGIGKRLLAAAESYAVQTWSVSTMTMSVITCRDELLAFYRRRGYRHTGLVEPFPVNPVLWTPKVPGLQLARLEKTFV